MWWLKTLLIVHSKQGGKAASEFTLKTTISLVGEREIMPSKIKESRWKDSREGRLTVDHYPHAHGQEISFSIETPDPDSVYGPSVTSLDLSLDEAKSLRDFLTAVLDVLGEEDLQIIATCIDGVAGNWPLTRIDEYVYKAEEEINGTAYISIDEIETWIRS